MLELIKKLREITGAPITECKKALEESGKDMDKAMDWLKMRGSQIVSKKQDRVSNSGLVGIATKANSTSILEINTETDFVALNEQFIKFMEELTLLNLSKQCDILALKNSVMANGETVESNLSALILTIGEKIDIRRNIHITKQDGEHFFIYMHKKALIGDNLFLGQIGVVLVLEGKNNQEVLDFGKNTAMHIASLKPIALTIESLHPDLVAKETEIVREQLAGNPMMDKILPGKINKALGEYVLLLQDHVLYNKPVQDVIKDLNSRDLAVKIIDYKFFVVGEGIDKKEQNFAQEVASMNK